MISNISDVIGIMGADGLMKYKSPNIEKWFGWQPDDLIGTDGWLTVHPDDLERIRIEFFNLLKKDLSVTTVEYRYKCKDGSYKPIELTATNLINDPVICGVLLNYHDISERKQAEGLLALTRQNYERFFNTIDDFLFVLDARGNILHTNATVINRLGYSREELLGQSILMVHPPERREEAGRITGEMLAGLTDFCPVPIITKSGVQIPVETRVSQGNWDGKPALFGVTKDISKIALSEEKFSKIFHINPSACGLTDLDDNTYIEVNEAFHKLLGFTNDEAIGKTAIELGILTSQARHEVLTNADSYGNVANIETVLKAKNGDLKHVLVSSDNINVQVKRFRFTVVQDITQRKMAEIYREIQQEILKIQTNQGVMQDSMQTVIDILKAKIGFDALAIRIQNGDDFPYLVQNGFSHDFLLTENSICQRTTDGGIRRAKDGSIKLECTCGLVISGGIDSSYPFATKRGSIWTNDSSVLLDPLQDDPRFQPRNLCIHQGYASVAVIPIRSNNKNIGLIQFNDRRLGRFTVEMIEQLEGIAIHIGELLMRKHAEDELQKSNAMLSLFMDHSPIYTFIKEVSAKESRVLKASENFKEMIRIPGSQMVGKSMYELFPAEFAAKMTHDDWIIASGDKILEKEETYNNRFYTTVKYPIDLGGKKLLAGFTIDVTEQKLLEKKILESERQYRTLIETAQEGISIAKGTDFVFVNPQMVLLTGFSKEELMSYPFMEHVHVDDRELVKRNYLKRLNGEMVEPRYHFRILKKDRSVVWIEISGNKTEWKGEPAVINFVTDITDRIKAETALRESEEKQRLASLYARSLIEASLDPMVTIDANGKITDVNTATENATGLTRNDLIGTDFSDYFTEQDKAKIVYQKVFEQGKVIDYPITIRHSSNKLIDVLYNASVFHDEEGKILGIFASARDVTERKRIEEEIRLKNDQLNLLNAQKDKLFSIIAHDLRSPFQTLLGFSPDKPEELMTYPLEKIQSLAFNMRVSANKLFSLLENLLEWSRMQRGLIGFKPGIIAISEVVSGILAMIKDTADKKLITINCDIPEDLTLRADVQMFESVVRNLVFNAIKFTHREGYITISAKAMPNNSIEISISDTGIGMKKEMIGNLFKLDANVSRKGTEGEASTGLGLIICNDFIAKHGGELKVESTVGKGSTFRFTLPR
jgi:PAS domain S-box-containing protein